MRSYGRIFFMRIFLLGTLLIWAPLILGNFAYIKTNDISSYTDSTRKISEDDCYRNATKINNYDYKKPKANAVIKLDFDEQAATVAIGVLDKNKEYSYAAIWKIPAERDRYTKVRFENLEQLVKIRESSSSTFGPYARFVINRNTLDGELYSEFETGVCSSTAYDFSSIDWKSGKIIEEEEYRKLFNKIKLKDDEITQNFEKIKKETKKF